MVKELNKTQQIFKDLKKKDYSALLVVGVNADGDVEVTPSVNNFAVIQWLLSKAEFQMNLVQHNEVVAKQNAIHKNVAQKGDPA